MIEIPDVLSQYMNGLKNHDVKAIAGTVADDLRMILPRKTVAKPRFLGLLTALYAGFPNWHYDHDAPEFRGGIIAVKWRQGGTHTDVFAPPDGAPIAPTGKVVKIPEQYFFYRLHEDQIVEICPEPIPGGAPWGILEQIGATLPG